MAEEGSTCDPMVDWETRTGLIELVANGDTEGLDFPEALLTQLTLQALAIQVMKLAERTAELMDKAQALEASMSFLGALSGGLVGIKVTDLTRDEDDPDFQLARERAHQIGAELRTGAGLGVPA
jgi:hypothetical protein